MSTEALKALTDMAALLISGASLVAAIVALVVARDAIRKSDRNTSAAMLVTLYEAFRQGWARFQAETDPERSRYEMAELMNTFEIACAIHHEQSIHGVSREILEEYLRDTLRKFADDEDAAGCIRAMRDGPSTFKYLALFLHGQRRYERIAREPLITLGFIVT